MTMTRSCLLPPPSTRRATDVPATPAPAVTIVDEAPACQARGGASRRGAPSRGLVLGTIVPSVLAGALAAAAGQEPPSAGTDPDRLYAQRDTLANARQAAELWAAALAEDPHDFESAWKLSRARYWLGGHVPDDRRAQYEAGIAVARRATAMAPERPEGHFWLAANMGALAESFGLRAGLRYRGAIKDRLETVLRLDPAFEQGSADRALGRWYMKVPGLFGGSDERAVAHLRRSLDYNPDSTASLYFLAETFVEMDRVDDARAALEGVLDAPVDPAWGPEDREFKQQARALLARLP